MAGNNELEILLDKLVKNHLEKKRRKKLGEEGIILEWLLREHFPKTPPTIRKKELNDDGDVLTYHINVPIPLTFDSIKSLESSIAFTVKKDCEVLVAKNYEVFVRFYAKTFPHYCKFKEEYFEQAGNGFLPLGMDRKGMVKIKLDNTVHFLIAGTTGAGKSTLGRCIITSILINVPNVQMYIIDQKRVEFLNIARKYNIPVAYDAKTINKLLNDLQKETERRTDLILDEDVNDAKDLKNTPPPVVLVIDELAEMNGKTDIEKENQDLLDSLARLSRACNFHIVCMTQKPSAKLWDKFSSTREMLTTRICLRVNDASTSMMVIDSPACSTINDDDKGRGIMKNSFGNLQMVQFFDLQYEQMKRILYENASQKCNANEKIDPSTDYIDIEGTVVNAEKNGEYLAIEGSIKDVSEKINECKKSCNVSYGSVSNSGKIRCVPNDKRREENDVPKRQVAQHKESEKSQHGKKREDNGNVDEIQDVNTRTSGRYYLL